jgi:hypothetical protein
VLIFRYRWTSCPSEKSTGHRAGFSHRKNEKGDGESKFESFERRLGESNIIPARESRGITPASGAGQSASKKCKRAAGSSLGHHSTGGVRGPRVWTFRGPLLFGLYPTHDLGNQGLICRFYYCRSNLNYSMLAVGYYERLDHHAPIRM